MKKRLGILIAGIFALVFIVGTQLQNAEAANPVLEIIQNTVIPKLDQIIALLSGNNLDSIATANPMSGIEPLEVSFNCVAAGGNPPLSYQWDFGDAASSILQNPVHTYQSPDQYTAVCTATDSDGDVSLASTTVTVMSDLVPAVTLSAVPTSGVSPLEVQFSANAVGGNEPLNFAWDFGDAITSNLQNPLHVYQNPTSGDLVFSATVTVVDVDGDIATDSVDILVQEAQSSSEDPGKAILTGLNLNPADGITERVNVITAQEGKVFYGHITGVAAFPDGNKVSLTCVTEGNFGNDLAGAPAPSFAVINTDFACQELYFGVTDLPNGIDAGEGNIHSTTVYFETLNITAP